MTEESHDYALVVSFPDQSPSFVHGYEAGSIMQRMRAGAEAEIEVTTHTENREVLRRMAAAEGWDIEHKPSEVDGWDFTTLVKTATTARLNPHGLRVVQ